MTYSQLIMVSSYSFKKNAFFCFSQSTCRILSYLKMSKNCEGIGQERWLYMSTGFLCCSVCWTYTRDITKVLWTSASSFKVTHRRRGGAAWRKRECRLNLRIIWDLFLLNFMYERAEILIYCKNIILIHIQGDQHYVFWAAIGFSVLLWWKP